MELSELILHIEALIFASDKPLTSVEITEVVNAAFSFMEDKITIEQIDAALEVIVKKYSSPFYPFEVKGSGGGWQFLSKKEFHKTVAQLNGEKFLKRLSAAALETLAIIAYRQPITKGEIETIRGVNSDYSVQKLLEKELIVISGRNEKMPGHPLVYETSKSFMDYFGINSADDLPKIKEVLAAQVLEPTIVNPINFNEPSALAVTDEGELINAEDSSVEVADAPPIPDKETIPQELQNNEEKNEIPSEEDKQNAADNINPTEDKDDLNPS
jgi:segregation and condensation protein B